MLRIFRAVLAILLGAGGLAAAATPTGAVTTSECVTQEWASFSTDTGSSPRTANGESITLNHSAGVADATYSTTDVLRLTPAQTWQGGSAWSTSPAPLGAAYSFSTEFSFNINQGGGYSGDWRNPDSGADGLTFVLQTADNSVGSTGGGMGYGGIDQSVAIEFDSWHNVEYPGDTSSSHIGLNTGGSLTSIATYDTKPAFALDDDTTRWAWIDYDGATQTLEVRVASSEDRPATAVLTYEGLDVATELVEPAAFVGFTAGTGGAYANHDILTWRFENCYAPFGLPATAVSDSATTDEDTAVAVDVIDNDLGDGLTVTVDGTSTHGGTTAVTSAGVVTYTPAADFNGTDTFPYTLTDQDNDTDEGTVTVTVIAVNDGPTATAEDPGTIDEGSTGSLTGSVADVDTGDTVTGTWTVDDPSTCTLTDPTNVPAATITCDDDGTYTVTLTADDGTTTGTDTATVTVANVAPTAQIDTPGADAMVPTGTVGVVASFTDPGADTHPSCQLTWPGGAPVAGIVDAGAGTCTATTEFTVAGVYDLTVSVTDDDGDTATSAMRQLVVYDAGASVRGNGTIHSPAGAFIEDPGVEGEARFGFTSRYRKGATTPTGNTRFVFRTAELSFRSDTYDWLVVGGAQAQYKGAGILDVAGISRTVNFMVTVIDGEDTSPPDDMDSFRLKLTDSTTGDVIYDNQAGADDGEALHHTTQLTRGNVVINRR